MFITREPRSKSARSRGGHLERRQGRRLTLLLLTVFTAGMCSWLLAPGTRLMDAATDVLAGTTPTNANPQFGIAVGNVLTQLSDAQLAAEFQDLHSLGVRWVRYDLRWITVQPTSPSSYTWTVYDRIVAAANHAGLHSLATIGYTPAWARQASCKSQGDTCEPADPHVFGVFAQAAAARYAPQGVHVWEVWNEPNVVAFWKPTPNPQAYTALLQATAAAIRSQDSQATILTGGLTGSLTTSSSISAVAFLHAMYGDGAKSAFDGVAMHPYTYPYLPTYPTVYSWREMADAPTNLYTIMQQNGDGGKKIWITEYGAPTNGPGTVLTENARTPISKSNYVNEDLQSQLLAIAVQQYAAYPWAGPFFWYSYKDLSNNPNDRENFFGLLRADGSHKPAYDAYKQAISNVTGQ